MYGKRHESGFTFPYVSQLYEANILCLHILSSLVAHHREWLHLHLMAAISFRGSSSWVPLGLILEHCSHWWLWHPCLLIWQEILRFLEKAMAPHSSTLAWKIPWTEEPGRLQSMGSRRVRHDWVTSLSLFTFMHWRRKWQPTPVFLPGESQGWGRTESDTTEVT